MKFTLNDEIASPQDLAEIIREVREYTRWFSHETVKKKAGGKPSEPPELSAPATRAIKGAAGDKPLTGAKLDELIEALEDFADTLPRLTIILAAPPARGLKKKLVSWCRQHVTPNVLVSFQFDSTLLGGMVVRYGSHIHDWSFRRQILAGRDKFPEVLRRV